MLGLSIFLASTALCTFTGIAVMLVSRKRRVNLLYGLTALAFVLLSIVNYLSTITYGDLKVLFARLVLLFSSVSIMLTYYFVAGLIRQHASAKDGQNLKILPAKISLCIAIAISALCMTPYLISGIDGLAPTFAPGMLLYFIIFIFFSFESLRMMIRVVLSRNALPELKTQMKYLIVGFLPIVALAPFTGVYLPTVQNNFSLIVVTPAYSAFFVLLISYAMIKHRLFGTRFYVLRVMTYTVSRIVITLVYILPVVYISLFIAQIQPTARTILVLTLLVSIGAAYYEQLNRLFVKASNHIFYQDTYDPSDLISEVNSGLVVVTDLEKMLLDTNDILKKYLNPETSSFVILSRENDKVRLIGDQPRTARRLTSLLLQSNESDSLVLLTSTLHSTPFQQSLVREEIDVIVKVPISEEANGEYAAYIVLGPKKSGSMYTPMDIQSLSTISTSLIIAIQNAKRFEEIQNFNATLTQRIDEATKRLRRNNEKLIAIDETKDDFISMASHQLRTPLTAVKGYLSMVLDGDAGAVTPMQRKMLNQAFQSSQRMVFLIADLLNVSRLKTGKFVIERTEVDLVNLIDQEIGQLRETAQSRGLTLTYDKPKNFPKLLLDETKTRQVVMNFIDNAIHYTQPGGHISVGLHETATSIELKVKDDGIGVPKAELHHLFTKFYRAANARRQRPDGTGLGLFMAKKVIIAQGGAVIADSKERKGSTFGFTLPKKKLLASTKIAVG